MRVGIITYAGAGNLGDDWGQTLVVEALRSRLGKKATVEAWSSEEKYDVVASGCGTLLDEACGDVMRRLADALDSGAQVASIGTGMSDPAHIVPTDEGRAMLNRILNVCLPGSWRRGIEAPDTFWLEGERRGEPVDSKIVGVNVGMAAFTTIPDMTARMAGVVKELRKKRVKLMPVSACERLDNAMLEQLFPDEKPLLVDGSKAKRTKLRQLGALLSTRGHLGVYATICGLKVVQVEFSSKIRDLYAMTEGLPRLVGVDDDWAAAVRETLKAPPADTVRASWLAHGAVTERVDMLAQSIASLAK